MQAFGKSGSRDFPLKADWVISFAHARRWIPLGFAHLWNTLVPRYILALLRASVR